VKLVLIYGLPGVGKLTVARELAKITGYRLFHIHLLADMIESVFEFGSSQIIKLRDMLWPLMIRRAAEEGLPGLITTFVFETSRRERFLDEGLEAVTSRGGEVLFVELRCAQHELERRLVNPSRSQHRKIMSIEKLNELIAAGCFRAPELPGKPLVIDTTELSPTETARIIAYHLSGN
jgi:hypothetical protein